MSHTKSNNKSGEFDLIARYFQNWPTFSDTQTLVPNGDDCLVIKSQSPLAISVDTIVEGVHFLKNSPPHGIGYRALATAVSDLIAMGASPSFFTLALTFNKNETWLKEFSEGLKKAAQDFKIDLHGGDTTQSITDNAIITIQVHGECEHPILRSTAQVGDLICVSGFLGDAAAAIPILEKETLSIYDQSLLHAFYYPAPPINLIPALATQVNSAIDISDGLLADLMHICKQSQVQATIDTSLIPISQANLTTHSTKQALEYALTGGDDYQLCFTIPNRNIKWAQQNKCKVIGSIIEGNPDIFDQHRFHYYQAAAT